MDIPRVWLACHTDREIAESVDLDHSGVSRTIADLVQNGKLADSQQAAANHATDFDPPIYNVCRKAFLPSEAVSVGETLEPLEEAEARRRMLAGTPSGNLPEGRALDRVSAIVGMSR